MRKYIPIFLTFLALIGCFLLYLHYQPSVQSITNAHTPDATEPVAATSNGSLMGGGTRGWVEQFDQVTGRKSYQFKVDSYEPPKDGTVRVIKPIIEVFMDDGQIVHVEGDDGIVQITPGDEHNIFAGAPSSPPRFGTLRNVVVKMYGTADQEARNAGEPDMTLTMSNARFDNDTFQLFTLEYVDDTGRIIHKDEVPVELHTKDYDFEGTGLQMSWNELDRRLERLEIAHGKQLVIKNTKQFSPDSFTMDNPQDAGHSQALQTPAPTNASRIVRSPATPVNPQADAIPAPLPTGDFHNPPANAPAAPQLYTATFFDNVHAFEGDRDFADGSRLIFDFSMKHQEDAKPTTPAASPPTTRRSDNFVNSPAIAVPNPAAHQDNPATPAPATPGAVATTSPADETPTPIVLKWSGKMLMVPTDPKTVVPLEPGQSIVRLVGEPAMVHQPATDTQPAVEIECAELEYFSSDPVLHAPVLHLHGTDQHKLTITQTRDDGTASVISVPDLRYSRRSNLAVLEGKGYASFPDPADPKGLLNASWDKSCTVHLAQSNLVDGRSSPMPAHTGAPTGSMQIERADLDGNVHVYHPQFDLVSNDLGLIFEPVNSGTDKEHANGGVPQLKELDANGDVSCNVRESDKGPQSIKSQSLRIFTARNAQGQLYANKIMADDSVEAIQDEQKLNSEHLEIALRPKGKDADAPATKPALNQPATTNGISGSDIELDKLIATDHVQVTGKDGASAGGDRLVIDTQEGYPHYTISGLDGRKAKVANKDSTLTGPVIELWPHDQLSKVEGPGDLVATQASPDPSKAPRKINMSWTTSATVDGVNNQITILGGIQADSKAADGPTDHASGNQLVVMLVDAPKDDTKSKPDAKKKPDAKTSDNYDFMQGKEIKDIALLDNAKVESKSLNPDDGKVLQDFLLQSNKIIYDPRSRNVTTSNTPGSMLIQKHQPASRPSAVGDGDPIGGRGKTAITWNKQFDYVDSTHTATFQGDAGGVDILHFDDGDNPQIVRMHADKVVAQFEPTALPTTKSSGTARPSSTRPATSDETPQLTLRHLNAIGTITIDIGTRHIYCRSVEFDPKTALLTCSGGPDDVVTIKDDRRPGGQTFGLAVLDTHNNLLVRVTDVSAPGR